MRLLRLASLLALAALSGCGILYNRPLKPAELESVRNVAVVSVVGNTFRGVSVGTTVFNNSGFRADVSGWNVDGMLTAAALERLSKSAKMSFRPIPREEVPTGMRWGADLRDRLYQWAAKNGFDMMFIIVPFYNSEGMLPEGYGLYERSFLGSAWRCTFTQFSMNVVDVSVQRMFTWALPKDATVCKPEKEGPLQFKARYEDYSATEVALLRERLTAQFTTGLNEMLDILAIDK